VVVCDDGGAGVVGPAHADAIKAQHQNKMQIMQLRTSLSHRWNGAANSSDAAARASPSAHNG
jgi:hypothetical protein